MKPLYIFFSLLLFLSCERTAPNTNRTNESTLVEGTSEDLLLRWDGDEYGMKQYVMALLKAGPNRNQDSTEAVNLQKAHLENINRMAEMGKLVLAGPFMDDWTVKGIYIFNVQSVEEARALTASDPAIQAGRLEMELHPWYGSAALMELNNLHEKMNVKNPAQD